MDAQELHQRLTRQDQLLEVLQKALGHELPNQLVAIQGLARILDMEEGERLSTDGRDYLDRLRANAQRSQELAALLAECVRASRRTLAAEVVAPADAVGEAVAEANQLFPELRIEYHLTASAPPLAVPGRALHQVLVQLVRCAVLAGARRVEAGHARAGEGVVIALTTDAPFSSQEVPQPLPEPFAADTGLRLFLVRQLVESWDGQFWIEPGPNHGIQYRFTVPEGRDG